MKQHKRLLFVGAIVLLSLSWNEGLTTLGDATVDAGGRCSAMPPRAPTHQCEMPSLVPMRVSRDRDHQDRGIVITGIAAS